MFVKLKDFEKRTTKELTAQAIAARAMAAFSKIKDGSVFALAPPAIPGFGSSSGFDFFIKDINGAGHEKLIEARNQLLGLAAASKQIVGTRPNGQEDTPQYSIDVDQERASALNINLADINTTLSTAWGGSYVNDFIDRGRVKPVYVQADKNFRMQPEDFDRWYVRNSDNAMVPFSAFATGHWSYGSPRLERYNGSSAVEIQGAAAPGVSSGDAMNEIDSLMGQLPPGFSHEWTGLSAQEKLSGNQALQLYAISILVVFLALPHSMRAGRSRLRSCSRCRSVFSAPCSPRRSSARSNDVYFKVGLLTTIGLAAKNAILIVEFAIEQQKTGKDLVDGDAGSGTPAPAADPDDIARLHPRRHAAGDRARRRFRQSELDRYRRDGRHDLGDRARRLFHPAAVRCNEAGIQGQSTRGKGDRQRSVYRCRSLSDCDRRT